MHKLMSRAEDLNVAWGLGFRDIGKLLGRETLSCRIRGVGQVILRLRTSDGAVWSQVFTERQYDLSGLPVQEARVQAAYDAIIAKGRAPLVIDCGANNGASSVWFSLKYPAAQIVAVEPDPENAAVCRVNTADRRIDVRETAIGSSPGTVRITNPESTAWGFRTARSEGTGGVRVETIRQIVESYPAAELLAVKVDIEGFESDLFAANTEWVHDATLVYVEPHDWLLPGQGTSRSFQAVLGAEDFEVLLIGENLTYVRRSSASTRSEPAEEESARAGAVRET